jgi:DNA-binding protein HU-beta/integration host factor subunit beta
MSTVTKKNIVEKVSIRTGLTQVDTKIVLDCFLEAMSDSLAEGGGIEIRGFGRFKVKEKRPRSARNPKSGELIDVKGGYKPVFEAARVLRVRVDKALLSNK